MKAYRTVKEEEENAPKDCQKFEMLEGPMNASDFDKDIHKDFWQYTITNKNALPYLKFEAQYIIPCGNVIKCKKLTRSCTRRVRKETLVSPHLRTSCRVTATKRIDCEIFTLQFP